MGDSGPLGVEGFSSRTLWAALRRNRACVAPFLSSLLLFFFFFFSAAIVFVFILQSFSGVLTGNRLLLLQTSGSSWLSVLQRVFYTMSSSATMILPSSLEGRRGPEWLSDLFTANPASGECDCGRSWSSHVFCIDCRQSCVSKSDFQENRPHFGHKLLRMRQFDHKPVVESNDLQTLADISGIQSYYKFGCIQSAIMFLYSQGPPAAAAGKKNSFKRIQKKNKRGHYTPRRAASRSTSSPERSLGPFGKCAKCSKILNTDRCTVSFCSVECKMKAVEDDPTVTLSNPRVYTPEGIELLATLTYAVAKASGEEYDISKWTST